MRFLVSGQSQRWDPGFVSMLTRHSDEAVSSGPGS